MGQKEMITVNIEQIDKNFAPPAEITEPDIIWINARTAPIVLYGVFYNEEEHCYMRLDKAVADGTNSGVSNLNYRTAGGRIRFRTDSAFIGLKAEMKNHSPMTHMPRTGQSGFDLYRKTETTADTFLNIFRPTSANLTEGFSTYVTTDGQFGEYTINFPLYDNVSELYIALKKDARLEAPAPYRFEEPIVYYGSSITQGGCASRPGNAYQAIIGRKLNMDHVNLGFSGSARGEEIMANYLAGLKMKAFVCDYDHNAPNIDHLKATHLPLYRAVRKAQPDLPIVFVSAPDSLLKPQWLERMEVVRATYETALAEGDKNVYFVPGNTLFEGDDWDACTVDGCHPNDLGFQRMAKRIEQELKKFL